jgi:hypothetical protein
MSSGSESGLDSHGKYGKGTNSSGLGFRLVTASDVGERQDFVEPDCARPSAVAGEALV